MSSMQRLIVFLEDMIAGFFLIGGLGLVFWGVVMRYVAGRPIFWIDEIATYLVIWGAFLGYSVALREGRHIQVVILYDIFSLKARRILSIFVSSLGLLFCGFFVYGGILLEKTYLILGQESLNSQTPLWIPCLIIPIAGVLFGLRFLDQLISLIKDGGEKWKVLEERRRSHAHSATL